MQFFTLLKTYYLQLLSILNNHKIVILVAHIARVVIILGGRNLIADASIFSATISIIRAWLLVTLTFVGTQEELLLQL